MTGLVGEDGYVLQDQAHPNFTDPGMLYGLATYGSGLIRGSNTGLESGRWVRYFAGAKPGDW